MPKKRKKRKKPPKFTMPGGPLRCKAGVPFHLECCDCGLDHIQLAVKGGKAARKGK